MTKKHWTLIATAVLLGGVSLYLNKDWFAADTIQIYDRSRPARAWRSKPKRSDTSAVNPVVLGFDRKLKLTSVKVLSVSELATNKYPRPLWHLVSDSNSVPTKSFLYGASIGGMRPEVKGARSDPLAPDVKYRLYIETGAFKGEHDFTPVPRTP